MNSYHLWGILARLGRAGLSVVLCVTIFVSAMLMAFIVKQIAVSQPLIEWRNGDGGGKIDFPARSNLH